MYLRKIICMVSLVFIFVISSGNAFSGITPGSGSLYPFLGGVAFDDDMELENSLTYGLGFGYNFDEHWGAEVVFDYIPAELKHMDIDVDGYMYRLDGLYHFTTSQKNIVPYLAAGFGGLTLDPDKGNNDTDFIADYGAGLKYLVSDNLSLRGDVRHVISFPENNLVYTLGLTMLFGGEKEVVVKTPLDTDGDGICDEIDQCPRTPMGVKVDMNGCPLDSDGDGVYDYMDECPDTLKGVKVHKKGCPLDSDGDGVYDELDSCPGTPVGVTVDSSGCPLDSDGDGVYDYKDKCPGTAAGVKVDSIGCPVDSDRDGVYDYKDECPGTPVGAKVDARGCWVIKDVYFDTNKWDLKPSGTVKLDEVLEILRKNPLLNIEIQGHTDNVGTAPFNQKLSEKRANTVLKYLVGNGIETTRLKSVGYGLSRPIASNDTSDGRSQNRRVELKPIL